LHSFHIPCPGLGKQHQSFTGYLTLKSIIADQRLLCPDGYDDYAGLISFWGLFLEERFIKDEENCLLKPSDNFKFSENFLSKFWWLGIFLQNQPKVSGEHQHKIRSFHFTITNYILEFLEAYKQHIPEESWPTEPLPKKWSLHSENEVFNSFIKISNYSFGISIQNNQDIQEGLKYQQSKKSRKIKWSLYAFGNCFKKSLDIHEERISYSGLIQNINPSIHYHIQTSERMTK
jgi:hypothetical protein